MFVITGATGNTGSVVANTLLDAGLPVRVLVRNVDKAKALAARGAEVVRADLADTDSLSAALAGATGVYLISPPDMAATNFNADRKVLLEKVARALASARVPHVVFLSSIGAHLPSGTGPIVSIHHGERALRESGVPTTLVRAGYFLENWAAVLPVAKRDGVLPTFLPPALPIPTVGTRDIGLVVAQALRDGPRGVRVIELSGPRDLSANDVATSLGHLLGRNVQAAAAPLDAVVPTFTSFGISPHIAGLYREMYDGLGSGRIKFQGAGVESVRGKIDVAETLRGILG